MDLPSKQELLFSTPLYSSIIVNTDGAKDMTYIEDVFYKHYDHSIDGFCPYCQKMATFSAIPYEDCSSEYLVQRSSKRTTWNFRAFVYSMNNRIYSLCYECTRNKNHRVAYVFFLTKGKITKIGQYPSMSEGLIPKYKKYRSVLPVEKHKELIKGIRLISHDVGIGAFVYLRRIFEHLIEEAHQTAIDDTDWDNDAFIKARMDDKIQLLQHHLPSFLVENRKLYGILSKGVHELSEQECLSYFDAVKVAIELILDEKLEQKERKEKIKAATASLSKIQADLKK